MSNTKQSPAAVPFNVERHVDVNVYPDHSGFTVETSGMFRFGKRELQMEVKEGMFLAGACRIVNDVARYMVVKNADPKTGQRVQLGPWTVVQFTQESVKEDNTSRDVLKLSDGTDRSFYEVS